MNTEIARHEPSHNTLELTSNVPAVRAAIETLKALRTFVAAELVEGVDYGEIPGTGKTKTLLLPGAQKIALYFNCYPTYEVQRIELGNGHLEVFTTCRLRHRGSETTAAEGMGSCSSMEKKYRYRSPERVCPVCKKAAIRFFKGDERRRPEFYCWAKLAGCGAKFQEHDPAITSQPTGQVDNPDIHDVRNTVLKMSMKRAGVSASLNLGALSEIFTQDIEDTYDLGAVPTSEPHRDPEPTRFRRI